MKEIRIVVAGTGHDGRDRYIRRFAKQGSALELRREPQNAHDPNAIGVWLQCKAFLGLARAWKKIGYVPSSRARGLSYLIDEQRLILRAGVVAEIRIGDAGEPSYVRGIIPCEVAEVSGAAPPSVRIERPNESIIKLRDVQLETSASLSGGEAVNLWLHPERTHVRVYAAGTVGGEGLIGSTSDPRLIEQLSRGLPVHASMDRPSSDASIRVAFTTQEEADAAEGRAKAGLQERITKPYRPRKQFTAELIGEAATGADIQVGDSGRHSTRTVSEYVADDLRIDFVLERTGAIVSCRRWSDGERLVRAAVSGCALEATVDEVKDGYAGDRSSVWKVQRVGLTVRIVLAATAP